MQLPASLPGKKRTPEGVPLFSLRQPVSLADDLFGCAQPNRCYLIFAALLSLSPLLSVQESVISSPLAAPVNLNEM